MKTHWIDNQHARLQVLERGEGPCVLLIPSLGRGAADFEPLATALAGDGYRTLALQPRGIGESTGELEQITLHDLADDAAAVLRQLTDAKAHVIGHAFGNRVARCLCADYPQQVRSLCLLAAGGLIPPEPEAVAAFKQFLSEPMEEPAFLALVKRANFAADSDPRAWLNGWFPATARAQAHAAGNTPREQWWHPGKVATLIAQGTEDAMAPAANGQALKEKLGAQAELVDIPGAGHAMLPEQPALIHTTVREFLAQH